VDLTDFDYSQPATVHWIRHSESQTDIRESRHFSQATDAIRFVMEQLHDVDRTTASITLENGSLTLTEIELLYSRLGRGQAIPAVIGSSERSNLGCVL
jgi:hypothetical protein